jgi:ribonuclease HI
MEPVLYFDGGSLGNGSRNEGYGSIMLMIDGIFRKMTVSTNGETVTTLKLQVKFPDSTNNEAELKTCLVAMAYADEVEERANRALAWKLRTDSQLVANLMKGMPKKSKSPHLRHLYEKILAWLEIHEGSSIEWVENTEIKSILGH